VKADVESYLNDHAIQVVWFFDDQIQSRSLSNNSIPLNEEFQQ
jgi:hypothetical protein